MTKVEIDLLNARLFWKSLSFEEYAVACDIEGIPCTFSKEMFDSISHDFRLLARQVDSQWPTRQPKAFNNLVAFDTIVLPT